MDWLIDQPTWAYYLPVLSAGGFLFAWWRTRSRLHLALAASMFVLVGAVWLIDALVVTDREMVEANTREILRGADAKDMERIRKHLSPQFQSGGFGLEEALLEAERRLPALRRLSLKSVDVEYADGGPRMKMKSTCQVLISGDLGVFGGENIPCQVRFHFFREGEAIWRVRQVELYEGTGNRRLWPPE